MKLAQNFYLKRLEVLNSTEKKNEIEDVLFVFNYDENQLGNLKIYLLPIIGQKKISDKIEVRNKILKSLTSRKFFNERSIAINKNDIALYFSFDEINTVDISYFINYKEDFYSTIVFDLNGQKILDTKYKISDGTRLDNNDKTRIYPFRIETKKQDEVVYVTNATSDSIVYYAYVFLTNSGINDKEIDNLRIQYLSKKGKVDFDEIRNSFLNQSINFINLYLIMRSSNNFGKVVDELIQHGRFKKVFKFNSDKISLIRQFNRKVFHDNYSCSYMRSDYEEEKFHKNTGVFSEELIKQKFKGYMIEKKYLLNLGMRLCKKCNEI